MTLYELFFDLELSLIERFPQLTPFSIRKEKACEVWLLLRRLTAHNERKEKTEGKVTVENGKRVLRRPATNWY